MILPVAMQSIIGMRKEGNLNVDKFANMELDVCMSFLHSLDCLSKALRALERVTCFFSFSRILQSFSCSLFFSRSFSLNLDFSFSDMVLFFSTYFFFFLSLSLFLYSSYLEGSFLIFFLHFLLLSVLEAISFY